MNSAAQQLAAERVAEAWPTQGELLGLPEPPAVLAARERRKGGRPPGARNRRTEDVAREVIERMGDPLLHLVAIATADVAELVAIGLKPQEAIAEKRQAIAAALPYLHQRAPVQVNVEGRSVVYLTVEAGAPPAEQNQQVIDVIGAELDAVEFDAPANPLIPLAVHSAEQLMPDQSPSPARPLPFWLAPEPEPAPAPGQAHPPAPAPAHPPAPARPPGGGGFPPRALSHAHPGVVFRRGGGFGVPRNPGNAEPGAGGGA